ncbi:hypothetical protein V6U71_14895 [Sphingopyxis sp. J-6]|uniref:hypothetical protein n=1 Tax=Sphingopyxis sp. J-6 TaxID=3122054 RepID=UPI00398412D3
MKGREVKRGVTGLRLGGLLFVALLPAALALLVHGSFAPLLWFAAHQLYYAPLSWIGPPFFNPDSEVMFFVTVPGRILTACCYSALWLTMVYLAQRWLWTPTDEP